MNVNRDEVATNIISYEPAPDGSIQTPSECTLLAAAAVAPAAASGVAVAPCCWAVCLAALLPAKQCACCCQAGPCRSRSGGLNRCKRCHHPA